MVLWDTLYISQHKADVVRNTVLVKIQNAFLYIIPLICTIICSTIIMNVDALWTYLTIPACMFFWGMYKFYYLPSQRSDDILLSVQQNRIIYVEPEAKYIIPIPSAEEIRDESVYFDFRGRGNSGWDHKIVIKIKESCSIIKITSSGEETLIHSTASHPLSIALTYIQLEHNDHEKLYMYLQQAIIRPIG